MAFEKSSLSGKKTVGFGCVTSARYRSQQKSEKGRISMCFCQNIFSRSRILSNTFYLKLVSMSFSDLLSTIWLMVNFTSGGRIKSLSKIHLIILTIIVIFFLYPQSFQRAYPLAEALAGLDSGQQGLAWLLETSCMCDGTSCQPLMFQLVWDRPLSKKDLLHKLHGYLVKYKIFKLSFFLMGRNHYIKSRPSFELKKSAQKLVFCVLDV
jgi:hypothetical protein